MLARERPGGDVKARVRSAWQRGYIAPRMGVPVFEIAKEFMFSAAHQIRFHGGKCERLHGHNWRVRVHARASELNRIGMVIDFADLQRLVGRDRRAVRPPQRERDAARSTR